MEIVSLIGYSAAALGVVAFLPQVIRSLKTRKTKDVSFASFSIVAATNFMWTAYGILRNDVPLMIANSIIFISVLIILWAKIKYK